MVEQKEEFHKLVMRIEDTLKEYQKIHDDIAKPL